MADQPAQQVVRLTRCTQVHGHTAMLVHAMTHTGYRWYPEYIVYEEYHDFNQEQCRCTSMIYPPEFGAMEPMHYVYHVAVTIARAVQDAAYSCLTLLHEHHTLLREQFRYVPTALEGEEGNLTGLYSDSTPE